MRTMKLGRSDLRVPVIAVDCMRLNRVSRAEADRLIHTALDEGAIFFDHADVYGGGECEEIFAEAANMSAGLREQVILPAAPPASKVCLAGGNRYIRAPALLVCLMQAFERAGQTGKITGRDMA